MPPSSSSSRNATESQSSNHVRWRGNPSTIAGAGAGLVSSIVTCPLDVIKTRLQAQKAATGRSGYLGIIGTVGHVWNHNGVRGFYRGLGPTILGYIPTWAIYFSVYDGIKGRFGDTYLTPGLSTDGDHHSFRDSMALHLGAAMTAGATSTICTNPIWVVKTRFMTQPVHEVRYRHSVDAFVRIYKGEGFQAFYRGLIPSLAGVSHVAVQFPLYEELKASVAERRHVQVSDLSPLSIFLCSSAAKMAASVVTYPHEVIRTRLQIDYARNSDGSHPSQSQSSTKGSIPDISKPSTSSSSSTPRSTTYTTSQLSSRQTSRPYGSNKSHPLSIRALIDTSKLVLEENGWRGMYRGLAINLMRTVPNSAITLLTYEQIMRYLLVPGNGKR